MVKLNKKLDLTFSALGDETRREILRNLRRGPQTVSQIAEPFDISLAGVSKHLKVLERACLIRREKSGRQFFIHLAAKPLREAEKWIEVYREFWESTLDNLESYVEKQKREKK